MYGSLQYDRQGDPLEPPGWRQELPRRWANSRTEKESKKNTTAEARAGEVQNRWFAAGEERLVTRRGLQDTAPERCAKVEALVLIIKPAGALDGVPGLLPLRQAPQRRLADTLRFARASAAAERSEKSGRAPGARRGEGRLFPNRVALARTRGTYCYLPFSDRVPRVAQGRSIDRGAPFFPPSPRPQLQNFAVSERLLREGCLIKISRIFGFDFC